MIQMIVGGCNAKHHKGFRMVRTLGNKDYLLVITKKEAVFYINNKMSVVPPNTMIIFNKNTPYEYGGNDNEFVNDWIHFDFIDETPMFQELKLPLDTLIKLHETTYLSGLLHMIVAEHFSNQMYRLENTDAYLRVLLRKLSELIQMEKSSLKTHQQYQVLNNLRTRVFNAPYEKWTVERMAGIVLMSPSYLQHIYKKLFGISCINDVIKIRTDYAKYHLIHTDLTIQEISEICGYENNVHFIRQYKKVENITPGEYRKKFRNYSVD